MNKIISLVVLAAVLMLAAGCGQQGQQQTSTQPQQEAQALQGTPAATQQPSSTQELYNLYNYGAISEYEYKITSNAASQQNVMNLKNKISSDTINGKAAWLQQSDMDVQGNTATTKMWIDKTTFACLKISAVMNVAGQTIQQEGQCPTQGPNSASATETPKVNYIGKESVTVPLGTFSANKYESNDVTYWSADNVPLPLKVSYGGEAAMVMELVSYK